MLSNYKNEKTALGNVSEPLAVESTPTKKTFGLQAHEDTMMLVDSLFKRDNCRSKSEFIEKAVRFYSGYLLNQEDAAMEFIAPQIKTMTDGIIKSSEQRLSRAMFKIAVELGAVTHLLAYISDVDDDSPLKPKRRIVKPKSPAM